MRVQVTMPVTAEKVRRGLYILRGVTHGQKYPGTTPCGGEIRAERDSANRKPISSDPDFRWECFCVKCFECDPNGWRTLAECIREAPRYWGDTKGG